MNILFLLNPNKDLNLTVSKEVISFLYKNNVTVFAEEEIAKAIEGVVVYTNQAIDMAIILGGDGTILNFAHKYHNSSLPFFGINIGRVGCLAEGDLDNYQSKLKAIIDGNYYIEDRNVIKCSVYQNGELVRELESFNEVAIHRGNLLRTLLVNMNINDHNKTMFYADGVLVATSTGSSAYNLSCGGPLLLPTAKNFVITPIAPQLRTITSLVINDTEVISIDVHDDNYREEYLDYKPVIFIDGAYRIEIDGKSKIKISKSNKFLRIIKVNKEASLFEPTHKVASSTNRMFK